jgi:hypothetical protein
MTAPLLAPSPALAPASLHHLPPAERDARIIDLCDRAIVDLSEARTLDQVREIAGMAEAFAAYTRKMRAALEAQNAVHLVVLLAEAKIGAELKAAQERGEVAERGANQHVRTADILPATTSQLGIPRQRAAEMKRLADAGEPAIRAEVAAASAEGRRASRTRIISTIPALAQRPPELTQLVLWLRNGAALARQVDAQHLHADLARHNMTAPHADIAACRAFLASIPETHDA